MEITVKESGDVQTLILKGRFDVMTANSAEKELNAFLEEGKSKIIVDLMDVNYISSAGIRVLLAAVKVAREELAGDIRLVGCRPHVQKVFDMAGFSQIFKFFGSLDEAVESYQQS